MQDLLSTSVLKGLPGGDAMGASGTNSAIGGRLAGAPTGNNTAAPAVNAAFHDSFENSLQAVSAQSGSIEGGKVLPLAPEAAELSPMMPMPDAAAAQVQGLPGADGLRNSEDTALPTGSSPILLLATGTAGGMASDVVAPSARTAWNQPPGQQPPATRIVDDSLSFLDQKPAAARETSLLQASRTPSIADGPTAADASAVRLLQPESTTASQILKEIYTERTIKPGAAAQMHKEVAADVQTQLRHDATANESDRLFTARMQPGAVNPTNEGAAHARLFEGVIQTTQTVSSESVNASLVRSPVLQAVLSAEPAATTVSRSAITEAFGKAEWGPGMGKQILWMVNQNISRAEIRLNPANLGPLEVRIDMDNDQVNVAFTSRHAEVREAVEMALPRLREMLEEKGLNLSDADVSQHSFAEQQQKAFEQADENGTGVASGMPLSEGIDQHLEDSQRDWHRAGTAYAVSDGVVDYYI